MEILINKDYFFYKYLFKAYANTKKENGKIKSPEAAKYK